MKLKVIGWTYYDDPNYEYFETTWATHNAVLQDVKDNCYLFTGYHHQEYNYCCPVLNNGKKIIFTQRGFGGLMAKAHGYNKTYDYSLFTFPPNPRDEHFKIPKIKPDKSLIVDEKTLYETYEINADMETIATADVKNQLRLEDLDKYALIEVGDIVKLINDKHTTKYKVISVDRVKNVSVVDEYNFKYRNCNMYTEEEKKNITEKYEQASLIILLKLEYCFNLN